MLYGSNPDDVIAAIRYRYARLRSGEDRNDGRKLALVVEGGGLRGVASAGGAVALAQLGFSEVFDEVYATSAAVMNASYFITNQPLLGISVYFDNCTTRQFVNPWRFWKIIDVDYIFDYVAVHEKKLDVGRLITSPSRLYVAVIDRTTGEGFMVDVRSADVPPLQVLKASAAIPVFYNRSVTISGRPCIDGGLVIPYGVKQAVVNGCTHILVLTTRPPDYVSSEPGWFDRTIFNVMCARGRQSMNRMFAQRHLRSREAAELSFGRRPLPSGISIATLCAEETENVERMTTSRDRLRAAAVSYGRKVLFVFGHPAASTWTLPEDCAAAGRGVTLEPLLPIETEVP
jgi:predicted patatin/cPLA2 family phospholipase